nr:uncharacterized protein LOC110139988 isoform X2 [Odocoileus virginianus texanus]
MLRRPCQIPAGTSSPIGNIAGDRVCCLWLHEGDQPVDTPRPTGTLSTVGLLPSAPAHAGSLKQLRRSAPRHLHWPRLGPPLPVSFLRSSAMASSQFQPAGAPHILLECLPCSALACPRVPANPSFQALSRGSPKRSPPPFRERTARTSSSWAGGRGKRAQVVVTDLIPCPPATRAVMGRGGGGQWGPAPPAPQLRPPPSLLVL